MSTKQLYEKTSEGMKEVSPLVAIEDIYSKLSDTPLEALVSLYNHVKCEWKGSVADTRRTVPLFLRRSGLFITYNNGTKYITEFFSAGTDQITTEGWVKDSNWTPVPDEDYISAGVKPGFGTIGYEQLNDNLKQLFREKVNVTNFPDDEDIASVDNMLKLKDREADVANFQSKGYVILRKNLRLVNGVVKNILTQDMINQANTIYEIRYDFDLNGETIEIKEGCSLKFEGGSIKNGIIVLNNTKIFKGEYKNVRFTGNAKENEVINFKSFGGKSDSETDNSILLNDLIRCGFTDIHFPKGRYVFKQNVVIDNVCNISGEKDTYFNFKDSFYFDIDTKILRYRTFTNITFVSSKKLFCGRTNYLVFNNCLFNGIDTVLYGSDTKSTSTKWYGVVAFNDCHFAYCKAVIAGDAMWNQIKFSGGSINLCEYIFACDFVTAANFTAVDIEQGTRLLKPVVEAKLKGISFNGCYIEANNFITSSGHFIDASSITFYACQILFKKGDDGNDKFIDIAMSSAYMNTRSSISICFFNNSISLQPEIELPCINVTPYYRSSITFMQPSRTIHQSTSIIEDYDSLFTKETYPIIIESGFKNIAVRDVSVNNISVKKINLLSNEGNLNIIQSGYNLYTDINSDRHLYFPYIVPNSTLKTFLEFKGNMGDYVFGYCVDSKELLLKAKYAGVDKYYRIKTEECTKDNPIMKSYGRFADKPNLNNNNIGYNYFVIDDNSPKRVIVWDGFKWWNPDGTEATQ